MLQVLMIKYDGCKVVSFVCEYPSILYNIIMYNEHLTISPVAACRVITVYVVTGDIIIIISFLIILLAQCWK